MQVTENADSNGTHLLWVTGEVDMSNADEVQMSAMALLERDDCRELVIDLGGVTFMDSSGVGSLVAIRTAAVTRSRGMRVGEVSDRARQVIEVCGLGPDFGLDELPTPR